jgi:hypothetical protein
MPARQNKGRLNIVIRQLVASYVHRKSKERVNTTAATDYMNN